MLESTNVAEHEGRVYCKGCHGKKYGPKGYGFGSGAGALSMETGAQFGNKESEMRYIINVDLFFINVTNILNSY